ncbi:MAG TPA: ABC transporter ATP-binding protein [Puia sp.]|jgi:ABC-2 type transport system ATP-binding protein
MGHPAVAITGLGFSYAARSGSARSSSPQSPFSKSERLFEDLDLEIAEGLRFGLFGPNGAGKTSLMHLMTGILTYEQGNIELFGHPVKKKNKTVNSLFGLVPQDFSFYEELTPVENLEFFGAWAGLSPRETRQRTEELLEVMNLESVRNKAVGQFSGGMKRKVNLAIGVIHQPRILFLDEPTVGVDVHTRHELIRYLIGLNEKGTTLVYTSHQLDEAEELCQRIALIDKGKIIACDDLGPLLTEHRQTGLEGLFLHLTGDAFEK